jgi:hypothetical protein
VHLLLRGCDARGFPTLNSQSETFDAAQILYCHTMAHLAAVPEGAADAAHAMVGELRSRLAVGIEGLDNGDEVVVESVAIPKKPKTPSTPPQGLFVSAAGSVDPSAIAAAAQARAARIASGDTKPFKMKRPKPPPLTPESSSSSGGELAAVMRTRSSGSLTAPAPAPALSEASTSEHFRQLTSGASTSAPALPPAATTVDSQATGGAPTANATSADAPAAIAAAPAAADSERSRSARQSSPRVTAPPAKQTPAAPLTVDDVSAAALASSASVGEESPPQQQPGCGGSSSSRLGTPLQSARGDGQAPGWFLQSIADFFTGGGGLFTEDNAPTAGASAAASAIRSTPPAAGGDESPTTSGVGEMDDEPLSWTLVPSDAQGAPQRPHAPSAARVPFALRVREDTPRPTTLMGGAPAAPSVMLASLPEGGALNSERPSQRGGSIASRLAQARQERAILRAQGLSLASGAGAPSAAPLAPALAHAGSCTACLAPISEQSSEASHRWLT